MDGDLQGVDLHAAGYRYISFLSFEVPKDWVAAELPLALCTRVEAGWNPCAAVSGEMTIRVLEGWFPKAGPIEFHLWSGNVPVAHIGTIDSSSLDHDELQGFPDDRSLPLLRISSDLSAEAIAAAAMAEAPQENLRGAIEIGLTAN